MHVRKLIKEASSSLLGHVALFEVAFSAPLFLIFLGQSYTEGTLTVSWAAYLLLLWAGMGAVGAAAFWFIVSLPLIKRTRK
jgi:hypothetical protein